MKKFLAIILAIICSLCTLSSCEVGGDSGEGAFYDLNTAYENGWISQRDIKHIGYFYAGAIYKMVRVSESGSIANQMKQIGFKPTRKTGEISESKITEIKNAYFEQHIKNNYSSQASVDDLSVVFLGKYGKCYAVSVDSNLWEITTNIAYDSAANIFWSRMHPILLVYRYN